MVLPTYRRLGREYGLYYENLNFEAMHPARVPRIPLESTSFRSTFLHREVKIDLYLPPPAPASSDISLLLINDGQNMAELGLQDILGNLYDRQQIKSLLCVGIHAGEERKMEYGIRASADYRGRGAKAGAYTSFVLEELLHFVQKKSGRSQFKEKAFAGFSLGGLSALDIVWNHPKEFSKVGVFSGSFWWRSKDQHHQEYDDEKHRLMHQQVRKGEYIPRLKFFFQCGNMDETKDRNRNGIIDSIDDTLDLVKELEHKGYKRERDIHYVVLEDGRHDIATWGKAMPKFLRWGWAP